jgi:hypothetical protein
MTARLDSAPKLSSGLSELLHSNVAKLLYLAQRARPDILLAVVFLITRVSTPDNDDLGKLKRVMRYLRDTEDLALTLEASSDGAVRWWVDASFAVHPNMRSHTGAVLSLGKGAVYGMSSKQKINTKSSCEAELVGVDDALPTVLWTLQFLKAQGFAMTDNVIYQDNQSTILLENNGTRSSAKRTRHLDIRYFFITDRVDKKRYELNTVLRRSCGPIHIPNRYRDVCSGNTETGCSTLLCPPKSSSRRSVLEPGWLESRS